MISSNKYIDVITVKKLNYGIKKKQKQKKIRFVYLSFYPDKTEAEQLEYVVNLVKNYYTTKDKLPKKPHFKCLTPGQS